jgi:hypothetical protein
LPSVLFFDLFLRSVMPDPEQPLRPHSILNSFESLKGWQKVLLFSIFLVAPVIVLICIGTVWVSEPLLTPRLLLILLAFAAAAAGILYQSSRTIEEIKAARHPDGESKIDSVIVGTILVLVVLSGGLVEMAGLISFSGAGFKASCIGLLASLASLVSGLLIGFIFGVPRSVTAPPAAQTPPIGRAQPPGTPAKPEAATQPEPLAQPGAATQPGAPAQPEAPTQPEIPAQAAALPATRHTLYEANTNLTQISDWLTKTIVGVGLVNWNQGLRGFRSAAETLGKGLQLNENGSTVGGSIIVFFGVSGFLCGYNLTQLFLARALARADLTPDQPR